MINDVVLFIIERFMIFWAFVASDIGSQYVYLGLCLTHIWIACDRYFEYRFSKKNIVVEPPLRGLALANFIYAIVFFLSVLSLGRNPLIQRVLIIPYIRLFWFLLGVQLVLVAAVKTFRLLIAWWKTWEGKANARRLVVRWGRVLCGASFLLHRYRTYHRSESQERSQ